VKKFTGVITLDASHLVPLVHIILLQHSPVKDNGEQTLEICLRTFFLHFQNLLLSSANILSSSFLKERIKLCVTFCFLV